MGLRDKGQLDQTSLLLGQGWNASATRVYVVHTQGNVSMIDKTFYAKQPCFRTENVLSSNLIHLTHEIKNILYLNF